MLNLKNACIVVMIVLSGCYFSAETVSPAQPEDFTDSGVGCVYDCTDAIDEDDMSAPRISDTLTLTGE